MSTPDSIEPSELNSETRASWRHLGLVLGALLLTGVSTYIVPGLEEFRPWTPGEDAPLSGLFSSWSSTGEGAELPEFAGAGARYQTDDVDTDRLAASLGSSIVENLGEQSPTEAGAGVETDGEGDDERVVIDPALYEGISIQIEDPDHRGLRHLWDSLRRTALGHPDHITRIGHYGDSSIATDLITHTVRRALQTRFGDAGHGFMLTARGYMPYGHRDIVHRASSSWQVREAIRGADGEGYYGYGGVQARGVPGAWAIYATDPAAPVGQRVSRFQIFHQRYARGGKIRVSIDGDEERIIETRGEETSDEVLTFDVPDGHHEFKVRSGGGGQPRLYGVVLEREGPGVVYDSMGMVGARAQRMLNIEPAHLARQLNFRQLDLLILGFGGNEADDRVGLRPYTQTFREVIRHFRQARPEMSCLVFAPLDQGTRARGGVRTMPSVPIIVEAQRTAALAEGCAFYNNFEAMGGSGAMGRWYRSRPRLGLGDLRHATPAGYEILGNLFFKALMAEFARYLSEEDEPTEGAAVPPSSASGAGSAVPTSDAGAS